MKESLSPLLAALADPTRRAILDHLRRGEAAAGDIARPLPMTQPAVSRHLKTLQGVGLITQRRQGTRRLFRLAPHRLMELDQWLGSYRDMMEANYTRLDAVLRQEETKDDF
jgi:DNA-binding transcriptional ArsR family regulator